MRSQEENKPSHGTNDATPAVNSELLADIDSLLDDNAEEFVSSYVQKGGE